MKYFLSALLAAAALHAGLSSWVRFTESGTAIEQAFFRVMPLPGGAVSSRRPSSEARGELAKLIAATPDRADLYALRARESERLLEFPAAEADWKKHASLAADKTRANLDLAAYYHRQLKVSEELDALTAAAGAAPEGETAKIHQQMIELCRRQLLPPDRVEAVYRHWRSRAPKSEDPFKGAAAYLTGVKRFDRAEAWIAEYQKLFPDRPHFAVSARAAIANARGDAAGALAVYDRAFDPLWPADLMQSYFALLRETRTARQFLAAARSKPMELASVARVFHYYQQEGNAGAAQRTLHDFRRRKESAKWTAEELRTMAVLWRDYAANTGETARFFYALYSLSGATPAHQEDALASLAALLLASPAHLAVSAGDLTFYKDIATADAGPGFLNGILSLLLNSSEPAWQFSSQEQKAVPYFARARASELIGLVEQRFPNSDRRAGLRAQLIQAYAAHGDADAVIRTGRDFLAKFPSAPERGTVWLAIADAHARRNQPAEEFAVYDKLLAELRPASPEYSRVLDRYVSRLAVLKRLPEALALLRRQIDRNPNEPALYERLAGFLEQNKMAAQIEQVYRRAMAQFQDRGCHHKLARYYLGRNQKAQFEQLTREVAGIFSGSDLETYFSQIVAGANLDAVMYRQVNLYAYQRFPHNATFVRNLLAAYQRRGTADPAAYENLLRRHWQDDDGLRDQFFAHLQSRGKLTPELTAIRQQNTAANPAARRMLAEGEAWRSHFEQAADPMAASFDEAPGDVALGRRAADLHRSLDRTTKAAEFARKLTTAEPRDWAAQTTLGEITGERAPFRRIAAIEPGAPEGYLEAATLHWDYYDFDGALAMIEQARKTLANPSLYAYEAGAIYENKRDMSRAIDEYLKDSEGQGQRRLLTLARRPALRQAIDTATVRLVEGDNPPLEAIAQRVALLESQNRKPDIEALFGRLAARTQGLALLTRIGEEARRLDMPAAEARSLQRQIELASDPVDKLNMRLALARSYEARRDYTQSAATIDALYRDNPLTLGIVRAAVDYHWRRSNSTRALDILNAAANAAHESRKAALRFEYARKATEAARYPAAREALNTLLAADPYNASYLGAMADTYARQGDTAALRAYYVEKIRFLGERTQQVAAMRRALAGVLANSSDYAGAMDQYIEVLNRYPEDEALTSEMAAFARRHGQRDKLIGHYQKTTAASPKDFRYHLVLARLHRELEDYPAAIAAYTRAAEVRPDRTDFLETRGDLEMRLLRFDEAAQTYTRLYDLSYRNPAWMERVAEIRARQGRPADAVAALRTAFVENREDSPQAHLLAAERLVSWNLLEQARTFADRGVALAGAKLLTEYFSGAETYARILARQRQYASLRALDPEGRLVYVVADVAASSYTAAEKQAFGGFLDQYGAAPEMGYRAQMPDWQARRLYQLMMQKPGEINQMHELVRIQRERLAFDELAKQLEAYWRVYPNADEKPQILEAAAAAQLAIGNEAEELRLRELAGTRGTRYLELLARRNPRRLIALGGDSAAEAAIANGPADLALAAVRAAGGGRPPVWTKSYTALAGLYFRLRTPGIDQAFRSALDSMRIGDRLGRATDREQYLAGTDWFYYGARYGEYLDLLRRSDASDYLASELEARPGDDTAYFRLGEYLREQSRPEEALTEYDYALELDAANVNAMDGRALTLLALGRRDQAIAQWKAALGMSRDLQPLLSRIAEVGLIGELKQDAERAIVAQLRRSNGFGGEWLLRIPVESAATPAEATGWILSVAGQLDDPSALLSGLADERWLKPAQKDAVYQRLMEKTRLPWARQWVDLLLNTGQKDRARTALASFTEAEREQLGEWPAVAQLRLAPDSSAPASPNVLREAAAALRSAGDAAGARRLLRRAYEQDIDSGARDQATLSGYAEVLLEDGDAAAAKNTLRRMILVSDPPFSAYAPAARLLAAHGRRAEADEFLAEERRATPWTAAPQADAGEQKLRPFLDARAAGRHALAATAVEVLLNQPRSVFDHVLPEGALEDHAERFLAALQLSPARRADIARQWADSLARADRLTGALSALRISQHLRADAANQPLLDRWLAEIRRREANRERAPSVTEHLRPDRIVRPMLAGGAQ